MANLVQWHPMPCNDSEDANADSNAMVVNIAEYWDQLKENLGLAGYFKEENSMPQFFYSSTFDGFDTHYFDFKNNKWNYHAD